MDGIKSRPKTFGEVEGQDYAKKLLVNTLRTGRFSRAYLFEGPRSIGKTTLASLFARAALCPNRDEATQDPCNTCSSCTNFLRGNHSSYTEVDAARHGTKEEVNSLLETLEYASVGKRFILMDESHMISKAGKDAALKALESPVEDDNTVFMFSTSEGHQMPPTLRSRCVPIPMMHPTPKDVLSKLNKICEANNVPYDSGSLRALAEWSGGHFREAENALEPLMLMGGINHENVSVFTSYDVDAVSDMLISLNGDLAAAMVSAESICNRFGADTAHSSIIRVLLEALQYGLSGMKRDTYESVKNVYSAYGSRLGPILAHFSAKGKMSDSRLLQSEIAQTYYKFIKGDFDTSSAVPVPAPVRSSSDATRGGAPSSNLSKLSEQREMKKRSRGLGVVQKTVDTITQEWGQEEVPQSVELKRS